MVDRTEADPEYLRAHPLPLVSSKCCEDFTSKESWLRLCKADVKSLSKTPENS
jgi:hypothetical protein